MNVVMRGISLVTAQTIFREAKKGAYIEGRHAMTVLTLVMFCKLI